MRCVAIVLAAVLMALSGCSDSSAEKRGREALEKMKESMPDVETKALAQKVTSAQVQRAQEALLAVKEYLGEPNGQLDSVTVNAIEAFQRAHGLPEDGMLNDKTESALLAAAASAKR